MYYPPGGISDDEIFTHFCSWHPFERHRFKEQVAEIIKNDTSLWNKIRSEEIAFMRPIPVRLAKADFRGATLASPNFDNVDFEGASFQGAVLNGATFRYSHLKLADFRDSCLIHSTFHETDLSFSDFRKADIRGTTFLSSDFSFARLEKIRAFTKDESLRGFIELGSARRLKSAYCDWDMSQYLGDVKNILMHTELIADEEDRRAIEGTLEIRLGNIDLIESEYIFLPPSPQIIKVTSELAHRLMRYIADNPQEMYTLRPRQFEEVVAELLATHGWSVELTPEIKDGGYDIFGISKDSLGAKTAWLVECKKYAPNRRVGVEIVRSLLGVSPPRPGVNFMLATTSSFTGPAQSVQMSRYDLDLRGYNDLVDWLKPYRRK